MFDGWLPILKVREWLDNSNDHSQHILRVVDHVYDGDWTILKNMFWGGSTSPNIF
jgi:hypothetical protein